MKSKLALSAIVVFTAISCNNSQVTTSTGLTEIDIAGNMQQFTKLKASDLGKTIRYVPLETTDESLVGNNPRIKIFNNKILVTTAKQCMLFDKTSGKFLGNIGHIGEDPEGYSQTSGWINEDTETLYFRRRPNNLIKYNTSGNYIGKVIVPTPPNTPSEYVLSDSIITGYYDDLMENVTRSIIQFSENGIVLDTISAISASVGVSLSGIKDISVLKKKDLYGLAGASGLMVINTFDDKSIFSFPGIPALWKNNNDIRFKQFFSDTVYNVKGSILEPTIVFNTGKWHWPVEERFNKDISDKKLLITYVFETPNSIYFEYIRNLYNIEDAEYYKGIYFKDNNTIKISRGKDPIEDDLSKFMDIQPLVCSNKGEYAGIIQVDDILNWMEENPDMEYTGNLAFLNNFDDDMNPVVVLIK